MASRAPVAIFYGVTLTIVVLIALLIAPGMLASPSTPTPFVLRPTQAIETQATVPYVANDETITEWRERAETDYLGQRAEDEHYATQPNDGWCGAGRLAYEC